MNIVSLLACTLASVAVVNASVPQSLTWDNLVSEINYSENSELNAKKMRNNLVNYYAELASADSKMALEKANLHLKTAQEKRRFTKSLYTSTRDNLEKAESHLKEAAKNNPYMDNLMIVFEKESESALESTRKDLSEAKFVETLITNAVKKFKEQEDYNDLSSDNESLESADEREIKPRFSYY